MSDARTSPPQQARYAVPAVRDLRRMPKVYESGPAEMHAPRQAAAPYARAIISSSLRVSSAKAKAELDRIRQAPPTGMARASRPLPAAMDIPRTCAVSPADQEAALLTAYRAFNARDIDRALAVMTDDIDWPNGWEGGRVSGKDAVRAYWTRQWADIDPHVEPVGFTTLNHGRIRATVQQTVRTLNGAVLTEGVVLHTYAFRGGLIARMDISERGPRRAERTR